MPAKKLFAPSEIIQAHDEYCSGASLDSVCCSRGWSKTWIRDRFKELGLKDKIQINGSRLFVCNDEFFDSVDSESKAYWLGFISADGCIQPQKWGQPKITFNLCAADSGHLEQFKLDSGCNHPIRFYQSGKHKNCVISVRSSRWADALAQWGVVERKTKSLPWPILSGDLQRHYLRGYFDGDGCWTRPKSNHNALSWRLLGNEDFLLGALEFIRNATDFPNVNLYRPKAKNISELIFTGRLRAQKMAELLYADSTVCLLRKKEKYELYAQRGD